MAKSGANIPIAADTRAFSSEIKRGVIEPLDDVKDALQTLEKSSDKTGDALGDDLKNGLRDGTKASERYVDDLEDKIKGLQTSTRRTARTAGDDLGDGIKRGTDKANEGLDELRDESNSTAREAAASFDGSAESIVDAFQEVSANAFAGFGPAGALAGLAVAAGIGAGVTALQDAADEANETKEAIAGLAGEIDEAGGRLESIDLGAKIRDWALEIGDSKEWFELWQDEALTNFERVQRAAQLTGVDVGDMLDAMSGLDAQAAIDVLGDLEAQLSELQDKQRHYGGGSTDPYGEQIAQLSALIEAVKTQNGLTGDAITLQQQLDAAINESSLNTDYLDARTTAVENLGSALENSVGSWQQFIDAETGAADPQAWLDGMQARADAMTSYADNITWLSDHVSPEVLQAVIDEGLDFAPMLQSIKDAGPEMADQLDEALGSLQDAADNAETTIHTELQLDADTRKAGRALAQFRRDEADSPVDVTIEPDYSSEDWMFKKDAIDNELGDVTLDVDADTAPASASILATTDAPYSTTISTDADTSGATNALDRISSATGRAVGGARRTTTIAAKADTGAASNALRSLARDRSMTIRPSVDTWFAANTLRNLTRDRSMTVYVNEVVVRGRKYI